MELFFSNELSLSSSRAQEELEQLETIGESSVVCRE